jgi:opacity protein-like surface antigen
MPFLAASLFAFTLATAPSALHAQTETPETPLTKQIHKIDLGVSGVGIYNSTVTGPIVPTQAPDYGQTVTQFGSNTAGALVTIRYVAKPYFGLEFNYGYARYTENYTVAPNQIQTKVSEYTFGYVATPPHEIFGLQPYLGAGAGTQAFKPTPRGGQGAPEKARATYYYTLGLQKSFGEGHFGVRAGFRELFFLDPDFGQNYLTILKHANTYEPQAGFFLRY